MRAGTLVISMRGRGTNSWRDGERSCALFTSRRSSRLCARSVIHPTVCCTRISLKRFFIPLPLLPPPNSKRYIVTWPQKIAEICCVFWRYEARWSWNMEEGIRLLTFLSWIQSKRWRGFLYLPRSILSLSMNEIYYENLSRYVYGDALHPSFRRNGWRSGESINKTLFICKIDIKGSKILCYFGVQDVSWAIKK